MLFFLEFSCLGRIGTEFGIKIFFFFSFSAYLTLVWIEIMREWYFLIFRIFVLFFWNIHDLVGKEWNSGWIFFFSFSTYLNTVWIEIMPELCFLIFGILLLLFLEFSCPGWVGTEFGTKFFFFFLGLSYPSTDRNKAGMMFFDFLNFFPIFFGIFLPGSCWKGIWD